MRGRRAPGLDGNFAFNRAFVRALRVRTAMARGEPRRIRGAGARCHVMIESSASVSGRLLDRPILVTTSATTVTRNICPINASLTASIFPRLLAAVRSPYPTVDIVT